MNLISYPFFQSGILIADTVQAPNASWDSLQGHTIINGVPINAALEIKSTSGGFQNARMTTAQKNFILPDNGMQLYDSTLNQLHCYINGAWVDIGPTGGDAPSGATYILQIPNALLPNAQALNSLTNGLLKQTAGVLSTATPGTDYIISITGTTNQIAVNNTSGNVTLSFPSFLETVNGNILDDGTGNASISGGVFSVGTSSSVSEIGILGNSSVGSNCGTLTFAKTGSSPSSNGDNLAFIDFFGKNSSGSDALSSRLISSVIANATSVVQSELQFRFYNSVGVEQTPLIAQASGVTITSLTLDGSLFTLTGSFPVTFNFSGSTNVNFPTSGTLLTTSGITINGTTNEISVTGSSPTFTIGFTSVLHTVNGSVLDDGSGNASFVGTGGLTLPQGSTGQRAGGAGTIRLNTTLNVFESTVDGTNWATIETSATGVISVSGTSNQITASPTTGNVILSFPSVLHSANSNVLDDGSNGCTFGSSGSSNINLGNNSGPTTTTILGTVTINNGGSETMGIGTGSYSGILGIGNASASIFMLGTIHINTSGSDGTSIGNSSSTTTLAGAIAGSPTWNSQQTFPNVVITTLTASEPVLSNGTKQLVSGQINLASSSYVTGILGGSNGGTGVNNGSSTFTMGGNTAFSGAFTFTGTLTNNTSVIFPISGTLSTTTNFYTDSFSYSRFGGM